MAAPTEYQVLSSLIIFLNDPILNLLKYPELNTIVDDSNTNSNNAFSWITSLESLLPQKLTKKQRKRIVIVDVINLISYGMSESNDKNLAMSDRKIISNNYKNDDINNYENDDDNGRNNDDDSNNDNDTTNTSKKKKNSSKKNKSKKSSKDENEENDKNNMISGDSDSKGQYFQSIPCLSDIAYNMKCGCDRRKINKNKNEKQHQRQHENGSENGNDYKCESRTINETQDENEINQEKNSNIVFILLRPHFEYQKINTKKNNLQNKIFESNRINSNQSLTLPHKYLDTKINNAFNEKNTNNKLENEKLNFILNNWLYKKKSYKHDMTKQSLLYSKSSIFQYNRESSIKEKNINENKNFGLLDTDKNVHLISPGNAICILQHWTYHGLLLPTLQIAINQYQTDQDDNQ